MAAPALFSVQPSYRLFPNKNRNFYLTIIHTLPMLTQARLIICNVCSLCAKGRLKTFGMVFRRPFAAELKKRARLDQTLRVIRLAQAFGLYRAAGTGGVKEFSAAQVKADVRNA